MNGSGSELKAFLETWMEGRGSVLPGLPALLQAHFEADQAVVYGLEPGLSGAIDLKFVHTSGVARSNSEVRRHMKDQFAATRWSLYTPLRPERHQRNRPHRLPAYSKVSQGGAELAHALGVSVDAMRTLNADHPGWVTHDQMGVLHQRLLRVLVCDGDRLLAWIGVFRNGEFDVRAAQELQKLAPHLARRLKMEEQLAAQPITAQALAAALNCISGRALLVNAKALPVATNARAREWIDADYRSASTELAEAIRSEGRGSNFDITPVEAPDSPPHHLLVERRVVLSGAALSERATRRWMLTPRESQVLAHLVQGDSNPAIAASLACTVRTVEFHVTNLLKKTGHVSRAALSAAVWALG